ncbi:MAG: PIN domain-containing protein [Pseudomonadota bacterium]
MKPTHARVFFDTNTFVYALTIQDTSKANRCADWLRAAGDHSAAYASLQVANEFINVLFRKFKTWSEDDVFSAADTIFMLSDHTVETNTIKLARTIRNITLYAWWDCIMLACAVEQRCSHFLSEDMAGNTSVLGMAIINPTAMEPEHVFS